MKAYSSSTINAEVVVAGKSCNVDLHLVSVLPQGELAGTCVYSTTYDTRHERTVWCCVIWRFAGAKDVPGIMEAGYEEEHIFGRRRSGYRMERILMYMFYYCYLYILSTGTIYISSSDLLVYWFNI